MDPIENPRNHDPLLGREHAAGVSQDRLSPAERALAPEADAPYQSHNAVSDDDTYVGQAGGYMGGEPASDESGSPGIQPGGERGEGVYGYPAGAEVGYPGGQHQPGQKTGEHEQGPAPRRV